MSTVLRGCYKRTLAVCVIAIFASGCNALIRTRLDKEHPPLSPLAGQLHAVRMSQSTLTDASDPNVVGLMTADFVRGWLSHALSRPILPDDPVGNANAIQNGATLADTKVTLGIQDADVTGRFSVNLCPDRKWTSSADPECIDEITVDGIFDFHLAPYVIPPVASTPAILAMHVNVARLEVANIDLKHSRWSRLNFFARWRPLLSALNGGLDRFRDNLSGTIEPRLEISPVIKIDPTKFKEEKPDDPAKDRFRVIVAEARGTAIKIAVQITSAAVVLTPNGLILVAAVDPTNPEPCKDCLWPPVPDSPSDEQLKTEFGSLLVDAQAAVQKLLPGATLPTLFAVKKDLVGGLLNEPGSSLDWQLDLTKRVSTLEDPAARCNGEPCPAVAVRLDLKPAQFFCGDICNKDQCQIDCSARDRCTPYLIERAGQAAEDINQACNQISFEREVEERVEEGCHSVCDSIVDPLGFVKQACHNEGCQLVVRKVKKIVTDLDPRCVAARGFLRDPRDYVPEAEALALARTLGVERQYGEFCTALNSVTEKLACEGLKLTAKPACEIAESSLNAAITAANSQLGELESSYSGNVTGRVEIRSLNTVADLSSATLGTKTTAQAEISGHVKFIPNTLGVQLCARLDADLPNVGISGTLKEEAIGAALRFGMKDKVSGLFLAPQGLTVEVKPRENPLLTLIGNTPSAAITCQVLFPVAQNVALYEVARNALGNSADKFPPLDGQFTKEVKPDEIFAALDQDFTYLPELRDRHDKLIADAEKVPMLFAEQGPALTMAPDLISTLPGATLPPLKRLDLSALFGFGYVASNVNRNSLAALALVEASSPNKDIGLAAGMAPSPNLTGGWFLGASIHRKRSLWAVLLGVRASANEPVQFMIGATGRVDGLRFVWQ